MNTQTTLKTVLILTVLALLTACGTSKSDSSSDLASRTTTATTTTTAAAQYLAYCNQKTQSGLSSDLEVYTDTSGNIRFDYLKMKITQIPADFSNGSYLEFFRWQADSSGNVYLDPTPVQARVETLDGTILTSFSAVTYWSEVAQIAANSGISDANTFFNNVRLVIDIRDPNAQFDALKVAYYNSSNVATINMDMLIPIFAANPSDYANDRGSTRATILQNLHPFAGMSNYTSAQYQTMSNNFCF